jgi:hypothetical protein
LQKAISEEDRKAKIPPISNLAGDKRKRVSDAEPGGLSWILKVSQI